MESLVKIQNELKAPKNQFNAFGKYKYRNQEDILEALKPLLIKYGCTLYISDEVKECGSIMYVQATACIEKGDEQICVKAQAGIDPSRKGMDIAQSFGSSSSYARKYALNGLFLIDDTKDADSTNTHDSAPKTQKTANKPVPQGEDALRMSNIIALVGKCNSKEDLGILWDSLDENEQSELKAVFSKRKLELK
jgi:hypothetical protein